MFEQWKSFLKYSNYLENKIFFGFVTIYIFYRRKTKPKIYVFFGKIDAFLFHSKIIAQKYFFMIIFCGILEQCLNLQNFIEKKF